MKVRAVLSTLSLLPFLVPAAGAAPDSFAYVLQADSWSGDKSETITRLAESGRDWIILDAVFAPATPWTSRELAAIRTGKPGRKIIAYISIGEAEDYRPYWNLEWSREEKPDWLLEENPDWEGNFRVAYWHSDWQAIILRSVDDAMASGFDGIYLDIVDGFEFFEKDGSWFIDNHPNPATGQNYRRDMVDFVKKVAARARSKNASAFVIPQNGSQLFAHPDFAARKANHEQGFIWLISDRPLKTLGISGR